MLNINFCGIEFLNPIISASGCFGFGMEYKDIFSPNELGGITLKSITLNPKEGNHQPRLAEVKSGILNSIGLENPGIEYFSKYITLSLKKNITVPIIASINGETVADYVSLVEKISDINEVQLIEVNTSCPNVENGMAFGGDSSSLARLVKEIKKVSKKPLIIKLSPNVTDIKTFVKVCDAEGADALSLINTLLGMKINIKSKKPLLNKKIGGMSGSAIMPVAVRCVYEARSISSLPIIGMGGIDCTDDALEFLMAGANIIAIGSAFFKDPYVALKIKQGLAEYCATNNLKHITDIIGIAHHS